MFFERSKVWLSEYIGIHWLVFQIASTLLLILILKRIKNPRKHTIQHQPGRGITYFVEPSDQEVVRAAVFCILDSAGEAVGVGVFFSATRAVTVDCNLAELVGTVVKVAFSGAVEPVELVILSRDAKQGYTILMSPKERPFLPIVDSPPPKLLEAKLVVAFFAPTPRYPNTGGQLSFCQLAFIEASFIALSTHRKHLLYLCSTFSGDFGAALVLRDGQLVALHQTTVNVLRENFERRKALDERLNERLDERLEDVEQLADQIISAGLRQGFVALLASVFAKFDGV